jgi:outer membrane protein TolC
MKPNWTFPVLLTSFYLLIHVARASEDPVADLIGSARANNPDILRAHAALDAALARVPQAASLPNPEIILDYMGNQPLGSAQSVRLAQAFPWPGTLGQRKSATSLQARAYWHEVQDLELQVAARIHSLCVEYAYLRKESALIQKTLDLFQSQLEFLEQASRGGAGIAELLRVETEVALMNDDRFRIQEALHRETALLESLIGMPVPPGTLRRLELLSPPPDPEPAATSTLFTPNSLAIGWTNNPEFSIDALRRRNPRLQSLVNRVEASKAGVALARLETRPELMIGAGYRYAIDPAMSMGGRREFMNEAVVMFSVSIPLWREKNRGIRDEAAAMLVMAQQEEEAVHRTLVAQYETLLSRQRDALRRARLYQDPLLLKAQQAHETSEAGYRSGTVRLPDLLDARRKLLEIETGYWRAIADIYIYQAELNALFGTEIQSVHP